MNEKEEFWLNQRFQPAVVWTAAKFRGFSVEGIEHLPKKGPVIVAINHISWLDPVIAGLSIARVRPPFFLAKRELFANGLFAWALRCLGALPLDRGRADVGAVRSAVEVLRSNGCMILFPEGTRSPDGTMRKPKSGVSFMAQQTGARVVPARVRNTDRVLSARMSIRFGPSLSYEGGESHEEYRQFAERIMSEISRL